MAHKAVEMKRSERSDAEIQLSKQVVQTFPKQVALELHVPLSKDVVCDEPGASRDAIARLCHAGAGAPERAAMVVVHAAAQTALHTYSCIFRVIM